MISSDRIVQRLEARGLEPRWLGEPPRALAGVVHDSRLVDEDDLFCAIEGLRTDGHEYVAAAAEAGAAAAVVEHPIPDVPLPFLLVDDSRAATAHLAVLFQGDPDRAMEVVGVTGTNGKTTTVWILRHLLAGSGRTASLGTLGVVGPEGERRPAELTTPDPMVLARTLAALRDRGVRHVTMEVSSHALDQRRVDGVSFGCLAFTNLDREHLDYHGDMESYRATKLRAAELVTPGGRCVVNADEEAWAGLRGKEREPLTYGLEAQADVRAEEVREGREGSRWELVHGGRRVAAELPLPGRFNVSNALAAVSAAMVQGLGLEAAAERLASTPQVPGRMEILRREPFLVIRDYAHTPEALERVLRTLRPEEGRLLVVFGCGGDRDRGKRPLMGETASRLADRALVTTDNPRSEDPASIAREVVEGMEEETYEVVLDRRDAIARALAEADAGDVVLLVGKGHEDYQIVGDEKAPFDEAAIVEELTRGPDRAGRGDP